MNDYLKKLHSLPRFFDDMQKRLNNETEYGKQGADQIDKDEQDKIDKQKQKEADNLQKQQIEDNYKTNSQQNIQTTTDNEQQYNNLWFPKEDEINKNTFQVPITYQNAEAQAKDSGNVILKGREKLDFLNNTHNLDDYLGSLFIQPEDNKQQDNQQQNYGPVNPEIAQNKFEKGWLEARDKDKWVKGLGSSGRFLFSNAQPGQVEEAYNQQKSYKNALGGYPYEFGQILGSIGKGIKNKIKDVVTLHSHDVSNIESDYEDNYNNKFTYDEKQLLNKYDIIPDTLNNKGGLLYIGQGTKKENLGILGKKIGDIYNMDVSDSEKVTRINQAIKDSNYIDSDQSKDFFNDKKTKDLFIVYAAKYYSNVTLPTEVAVNDYKRKNYYSESDVPEYVKDVQEINNLQLEQQNKLLQYSQTNDEKTKLLLKKEIIDLQKTEKLKTETINNKIKTDPDYSDQQKDFILDKYEKEYRKTKVEKHYDEKLTEYDSSLKKVIDKVKLENKTDLENHNINQDTFWKNNANMVKKISAMQPFLDELKKTFLGGKTQVELMQQDLLNGKIGHALGGQDIRNNIQSIIDKGLNDVNKKKELSLEFVKDYLKSDTIDANDFISNWLANKGYKNFNEAFATDAGIFSTTQIGTPLEGATKTRYPPDEYYRELHNQLLNENGGAVDKFLGTVGVLLNPLIKVSTDVFHSTKKGYAEALSTIGSLFGKTSATDEAYDAKQNQENFSVLGLLQEANKMDRLSTSRKAYIQEDFLHGIADASDEIGTLLLLDRLGAGLKIGDSFNLLKVEKEGASIANKIKDIGSVNKASEFIKATKGVDVGLGAADEINNAKNVMGKIFKSFKLDKTGYTSKKIFNFGAEFLTNVSMSKVLSKYFDTPYTADSNDFAIDLMFTGLSAVSAAAKIINHLPKGVAETEYAFNEAFTKNLMNISTSEWTKVPSSKQGELIEYSKGIYNKIQDTMYKLTGQSPVYEVADGVMANRTESLKLGKKMVEEGKNMSTKAIEDSKKEIQSLRDKITKIYNKGNYTKKDVQLIDKYVEDINKKTKKYLGIYNDGQKLIEQGNNLVSHQGSVSFWKKIIKQYVKNAGEIYQKEKPLIQKMHDVKNIGKIIGGKRIYIGDAYVTKGIINEKNKDIVNEIYDYFEKESEKGIDLIKETPAEKEIRLNNVKKEVDNIIISNYDNKFQTNIKENFRLSEGEKILKTSDNESLKKLIKSKPVIKNKEYDQLIFLQNKINSSTDEIEITKLKKEFDTIVDNLVQKADKQKKIDDVPLFSNDKMGKYGSVFVDGKEYFYHIRSEFYPGAEYPSKQASKYYLIPMDEFKKNPDDYVFSRKISDSGNPGDYIITKKGKQLEHDIISVKVGDKWLIYNSEGGKKLNNLGKNDIIELNNYTKKADYIVGDTNRSRKFKDETHFSSDVTDKKYYRKVNNQTLGEYSVDNKVITIHDRISNMDNGEAITTLYHESMHAFADTLEKEEKKAFNIFLKEEYGNLKETKNLKDLEEMFVDKLSKHLSLEASKTLRGKVKAFVNKTIDAFTSLFFNEKRIGLSDNEKKYLDKYTKRLGEDPQSIVDSIKEGHSYDKYYDELTNAIRKKGITIVFDNKIENKFTKGVKLSDKDKYYSSMWNKVITDNKEKYLDNFIVKDLNDIKDGDQILIDVKSDLEFKEIIKKAEDDSQIIIDLNGKHDNFNENILYKNGEIEQNNLITKDFYNALKEDLTNVNKLKRMFIPNSGIVGIPTSNGVYYDLTKKEIEILNNKSKSLIQGQAKKFKEIIDLSEDSLSSSFISLKDPGLNNIILDYEKDILKKQGIKLADDTVFSEEQLWDTINKKGSGITSPEILVKSVKDKLFQGMEINSDTLKGLPEVEKMISDIERRTIKSYENLKGLFKKNINTHSVVKKELEGLVTISSNINNSFGKISDAEIRLGLNEESFNKGDAIYVKYKLGKNAYFKTESFDKLVSSEYPGYKLFLTSDSEVKYIGIKNDVFYDLMESNLSKEQKNTLHKYIINNPDNKDNVYSNLFFLKSFGMDKSNISKDIVNAAIYPANFEKEYTKGGKYTNKQFYDGLSIVFNNVDNETLKQKPINILLLEDNKSDKTIWGINVSERQDGSYGFVNSMFKQFGNKFGGEEYLGKSIKAQVNFDGHCFKGVASEYSPEQITEQILSNKNNIERLKTFMKNVGRNIDFNFKDPESVNNVVKTLINEGYLHGSALDSAHKIYGGGAKEGFTHIDIKGQKINVYSINSKDLSKEDTINISRQFDANILDTKLKIDLVKELNDYSKIDKNVLAKGMKTLTTDISKGKQIILSGLPDGLKKELQNQNESFIWDFTNSLLRKISGGENINGYMSLGNGISEYSHNILKKEFGDIVGEKDLEDFIIVSNKYFGGYNHGDKILVYRSPIDNAKGISYKHMFFIEDIKNEFVRKAYENKKGSINITQKMAKEMGGDFDGDLYYVIKQKLSDKLEKRIDKYFKSDLYNNTVATLKPSKKSLIGAHNTIVGGRLESKANVGFAANGKKALSAMDDIVEYRGYKAYKESKSFKALNDYNEKTVAKNTKRATDSVMSHTKPYLGIQYDILKNIREKEAKGISASKIQKYIDDTVNKLFVNEKKFMNIVTDENSKYFIPENERLPFEINGKKYYISPLNADNYYKSLYGSNDFSYNIKKELSSLYGELTNTKNIVERSKSINKSKEIWNTRLKKGDDFSKLPKRNLIDVSNMNIDYQLLGGMKEHTDSLIKIKSEYLYKSLGIPGSSPYDMTSIKGLFSKFGILDSKTKTINGKKFLFVGNTFKIGYEKKLKKFIELASNDSLINKSNAHLGGNIKNRFLGAMAVLGDIDELSNDLKKMIPDDIKNSIRENRGKINNIDTIDLIKLLDVKKDGNLRYKNVGGKEIYVPQVLQKAIEDGNSLLKGDTNIDLNADLGKFVEMGTNNEITRKDFGFYRGEKNLGYYKQKDFIKKFNYINKELQLSPDIGEINKIDGIIEDTNKVIDDPHLKVGEKLENKNIKIIFNKIEEDKYFDELAERQEKINSESIEKYSDCAFFLS